MKLEMIFMIGNLKQDKEDAQKLLAWVKIINWLDNAILGIQGLPPSPLSGLLDNIIAELRKNYLHLFHLDLAVQFAACP